jgi:hypothetical protein
MLKRIIVVTLIGTSVLAASRLSTVKAADNPLQGAWQVTNTNGFAGIFLFSTKHYSMMAWRPIVRRSPLRDHSGVFASQWR